MFCILWDRTLGYVVLGMGWAEVSYVVRYGWGQFVLNYVTLGYVWYRLCLAWDGLGWVVLVWEFFGCAMLGRGWVDVVWVVLSLGGLMKVTFKEHRVG